ncbi:MAG: hypothetical protein KAS76_01225 [Thermoplasmatales archaeon]|nr:hypothetical protein [Thermoplasmatales archaeon]
MGKEKIIPILALVVLIIGGTSSAYVYTTTDDSTYININNQDYTIDQLSFIGGERNFETFSGIALDDLIIKIGVPNPEKHEYTITAADGYQKTVKWENMKNGLLTKDKISIFSDLPKSFRVRDIVKIEVI